jgi:segregation and condensation protein B
MPNYSLEHIVEAVLMSSSNTMSPKKIVELLSATDEVSPPNSKEVREALGILSEKLEGRAVELIEVATGFRIQVKQKYYKDIKGIFEEKPTKYSKALLETLAIITYRQPITRSEIEEIRGVSVSSQIVKNLLERQWVKIVGHKEVPGRPSMYGTTSELLDYFNLKTLDELPTLVEMQDISQLNQELDLNNPN